VNPEGVLVDAAGAVALGFAVGAATVATDPAGFVVGVAFTVADAVCVGAALGSVSALNEPPAVVSVRSTMGAWVAVAFASVVPGAATATLACLAAKPREIPTNARTATPPMTNGTADRFRGASVRSGAEPASAVFVRPNGSVCVWLPVSTRMDPELTRGVGGPAAEPSTWRRMRSTCSRALGAKGASAVANSATFW